MRKIPLFVIVFAQFLFTCLPGAMKSAHAASDNYYDPDHSVTKGSNNGGRSSWRSPAGDAKLLNVIRGRSLKGPVPVAFNVGFGSRTISVHCATNELGNNHVFIQITEDHQSYYDSLPHNMSSAECYQRLEEKAKELSVTQIPLGFFDLLSKPNVVTSSAASQSSSDSVSQPSQTIRKQRSSR